MKRYVIGGVGLVIVLFIISALIPRQGTKLYGLCRVFLELNIPYPLTLRVLQVEESGTRTDIIYSDLDGFGYESVSRLRCQFSAKSDGSVVLKDYQFDDYKRPSDVKNRAIEDFNRSIPTLLENLPSLSLPDPLPDDISDLKTSD